MSLILGGGDVYARPWADLASGDTTLAGWWKPSAGMLIGDRWIAAITTGGSSFFGAGMLAGVLRANCNGSVLSSTAASFTTGWNSVVVAMSSTAQTPYAAGSVTVKAWLNGSPSTPQTISGVTQSVYAVVALGQASSIAGGASSIAAGKFAEWSTHAKFFSDADATAHAAGADARGLPCCVDLWSALDSLDNRRGSRPLQMVGAATFDTDHPTIASWPPASGGVFSPFAPRIIQGVFP